MTAFQRLFVGTNPLRTATRVALLVVTSYVVFGHLLLPVRGVGISMRPTIEPGGYVFVSTLTYRWRNPRRGDIVAVRMAGRSVVYVKRVVALPGQRLAFRGGVLAVDGATVDEPYVVHRAPWELSGVHLDADEYFVVGDNRGMPLDAHELGVVTRTRLIGPVLF